MENTLLDLVINWDQTSRVDCSSSFVCGWEKRKKKAGETRTRQRWSMSQCRAGPKRKMENYSYAYCHSKWKVITNTSSIWREKISLQNVCRMFWNPAISLLLMSPQLHRLPATFWMWVQTNLSKLQSRAYFQVDMLIRLRNKMALTHQQIWG